MRRGGPDPEKTLPVLEHLEELRRVLLFSIAAVTIGAIAAWFISDEVLGLLSKSVGVPLHFAGVSEAFYVRMKIALLLGLLAALPVVLHRVWRFVAPAMTRRETSALLPLVVMSTLLFYAGVAFAYLVAVPVGTRFLLAFGSGVLEPVLMIGDYFGFVTRFSLAFGLVFQLPLVVSLLTYAGIVSSRGLLAQWRYAVVLIFIVAAVLTPPDVASQVIMAVPLLGLYFLSVWVSRFVERRRPHRPEA